MDLINGEIEIRNHARRDRTVGSRQREINPRVLEIDILDVHLRRGGWFLGAWCGRFLGAGRGFGSLVFLEQRTHFRRLSVAGPTCRLAPAVVLPQCRPLNALIPSIARRLPTERKERAAKDYYRRLFLDRLPHFTSTGRRYTAKCRIARTTGYEPTYRCLSVVGPLFPGD